MRSLKIWLTMVLTFLVLGCASKPPEKEVVTEVKYIYVTVPERLTKPIVPKKPIGFTEYKAFSIPEKEGYWADRSIELMENIAQCNRTLEAIRKIQGTPNTQNKK